MRNSIITKTAASNNLSLKTQALATLVAIVAAVALPQLFHVIGAISGLGNALGETFLPMHLPIILVGLLAGPYAGMVSGAVSPLISFAMSGMPGIVMLPFMIIELACYGFFAGLLRNRKMPAVGKVAIAQLAGRIIRAAVILLAVYAFGNEAIKTATIWKSIAAGLPGLILQWSMLPLIVFWVNNRIKNEQ